MERIIAKCGLPCSECGAYKATIAHDEELRAEVAKAWSKMYGADIEPEDINCLGCHNEEVLFSHCNVCEIRACAAQRGLDNCGLCDDYICEKLEKFFEFVPENKVVLDKVRAERTPNS